MKRIGFWLSHLVFVLFLLSAVIALLTSRSVDINLREGESIPLSEIAAALNLDIGDSTIIRLEKFTLDKDSRGAPLFRSDLNLITEAATNIQFLSVNHPVSVRNIQFYQKSYTAGFKKLLIEFEGRRYDLLSWKGNLVTKTGLVFHFYPAGMDRGKLSYRYDITDKDGGLKESGSFDRSMMNIPALDKIGFRIIEEDYEFASILQAVYSPFLFPLAVTAILFLLALALILRIPEEGKADD